MNSEQSLIIAPNQVLPLFQFNESAQEAKKVALITASFVDRVTDAESKAVAVNAQIELKRIISAIEKDRKQWKEPLLKAGRQLDTLCATEALEVEREFNRISQEVGLFDDIERSRVLEEQRLQRAELERIESEKQSEIKRIADEQAAREAEARRVQEEIDRKARESKEAAERKAREEREAAEKLAREATNKNEREAAEKARVEAEQSAAEAKIESNKTEAAAKVERERVEAALREQAATAQAQTAAIEEKAGDAAYCAAKPVETTKVAGQRQSTDWNIVVEQPFVLAKYHPDLVDIKPRLGDIKQRLNAGIEVKGIKAERKFTYGVIVPKDKKAIEV